MLTQHSFLFSLGLEFSYFISYILLMLFMDMTSLEISGTPIVAYKNIEGKNPEYSFFQFFCDNVITM